jgi:long-subunit acyl-CoA synthetase (AMP-forming)
MAGPGLSIVEGPKSPPLLATTFIELFDSERARNDDGIAIISHQQNTQLTYGQLRLRSVTLATSLYHLGVRKDDRVAINLGNRFEYLEVSESSQRVLDKLTVCRSSSHAHGLVLIALC